MVRALDALRPRLTAENRLRLRWETLCRETEPLIADVLSGANRPALAFNDHTTSVLLHPDGAVQERPFDQVPDYPAAPFDAPRFQKKMADRARRAPVSSEEYVARLTSVWSRRAESVLKDIDETSVLLGGERGTRNSSLGMTLAAANSHAAAGGASVPHGNR